MKEEASSYLFHYFNHIQEIRNKVQAYFTDCFNLSQLTLKTVIFGFHNTDNDTILIQNNILALLKLHICSTKKCNF